MTTRFFSTLAACLVVTGSALADIRTARIDVPDAELVGKARLQVMVWDVFDAELYASGGDWSRNEPFALSLRYLRNFSGGQIVERTMAELKRQGLRDGAKLARWTRELSDIIPNVGRRTTITGVYTDDRRTVFYKNGTRIGTIADPEFGRRFFNIWLGAKASHPKVRDRLLGRS